MNADLAQDIVASNVVFSTVIRGFMHLARLRRGEVCSPKIDRLILLITTDKHQPLKTVLIHSAAGGVGIAAIQIAKMLGAEVLYIYQCKNPR